MPGASVASTFENELNAALPSRFANMTTGSTAGNRAGSDRNSSNGSGTMQRGKSLAPTSSLGLGSTSNGGYSASFGGKSSNYTSSSDRSASSKIVHSFPLSVSSKVSTLFITVFLYTVESYQKWTTWFGAKITTVLNFLHYIVTQPGSSLKRLLRFNCIIK